MIWKYHALTASGLDIHGQMSGSKNQCKSFLKDENLIEVVIYPDLMQWIKIHIHSRFSVNDLAVFFDDLGDMLNSGMSLRECIGSLVNTSTHERMRHILVDVNDALFKGDSLAEAFKNTKSFPAMVISCLSCAEQSGRMLETVYLLGKYYHYRQKVKEQLGSAFFYPVIVIIILMAVMLFISLKVIPQLKPLLPEEAYRNPATTFVLGFSYLFQYGGIYALLTVLIVCICIVIVYKENRLAVESCLFKFPIIGEIIKEMRISMSLKQLTVLYKSGIPIIKAIEQMNESLPGLISQRLMVCRSLMIGGLSFSQALENEHIFPTALCLAVRKAEQTVNWDTYLTNISEYFEKRSRDQTQRITQLIQPVLFSLCGLFLAIIGLAFLVPIYGSLTRISVG